MDGASHSSFLEPWTAAEVMAELLGMSSASAARRSERLVAPRRRDLPDLPVGIAVGLKDGLELGLAEGLEDGIEDGLELGLAEGLELGELLGVMDGEGEGLPLGRSVGASDFELLLFC